MSFLEERIKQVEEFYTSLDKDLAAFQLQAGYSCIGGCSKCCSTPNIETTILEMLPYAAHLYKENTIEQVYEELSKMSSTTCALYKPAGLKGGCASYQHRGLVCRLFGYSFTKDKEGKQTLLTCKDIKAEYTKEYESITEKAQSGTAVPMANMYYNKLTDIDYNLSQKLYPINEAMRLAIEMIFNHFRYSGNPAAI